MTFFIGEFNITSFMFNFDDDVFLFFRKTQTFWKILRFANELFNVKLATPVQTT